MLTTNAGKLASGQHHSVRHVGTPHRSIFRPCELWAGVPAPHSSWLFHPEEDVSDDCQVTTNNVWARSKCIRPLAWASDECPDAAGHHRAGDFPTVTGA